jgi:senataxin
MKKIIMMSNLMMPFLQAAVKCQYGRSLFERLSGNGLPSHLLNTQYRMHPSICLFPNLNFYGGQLINGENVRNRCNGLKDLVSVPYQFINVNDAVEQDGDYDGNFKKSKRNPVEAAVVVRIIKQLRKGRIDES